MAIAVLGWCMCRCRCARTAVHTFSASNWHACMRRNMTIYMYGLQLAACRSQIMTDPDAPSPSDPTMREYLHWYAHVLVYCMIWHRPIEALFILLYTICVQSSCLILFSCHTCMHVSPCVNLRRAG
jgi:hypothetical protein